jgi:hypothetical protein
MRPIYKNLQQFRLLVVFLVISTPVVIQAEMITIEEFFQTAMPSKTVIKTFSHSLRDGFYSSVYSSKYLAVVNSHERIVDKSTGPMEIGSPAEIDIFSAQGRILTLTREEKKARISGFIIDSTDYFVFERPLEDRREVGIYEMDGKLVKLLTGFKFVSVSPGGKYFYHSGPDEQIGIFCTDREERFQITSKGSVYAKAASDSTLLVLDYRSLSLWDIDSQQKLWESDIPSLRFSVEGSSSISYSSSADIIVASHLLGCYCFDFQGNFFWSEENFNYADMSKEFVTLIMAGVSKENGTVAIVSFERESDALLVRLFNREGELQERFEINLSPDLSFTGNWGRIAYVFEEYVLFHFMAGGHVTGILYYNGQNWTSAVIDGFWYLLDPEKEIKTLIGFDSKSNAISAFSIK